MSWFTSASQKIAEVLEQLATANARLDALDREVHRMLEEFKRLLEHSGLSQESFRNKTEQRYEELFLRIVQVEAVMKATLEKATLVEAREGAREGAKEALLEIERRGSPGGSKSPVLSPADRDRDGD